MITATSKNQVSSIVSSSRHCERRTGLDALRSPFYRALRDDVMNEKEKQNSQNRVQAHEAEECKQAVARMNVFGITVGSPHEAIDQPRLPAELGGHPARCVGDMRQWKAQQENP